ncbi:MAG: hypothetical protein CL607_18395 [Anaerolineaceae bacterium]|uniref:Uncharacterized protein n=1 Tax=Phototrophicus methaneseepsis TaxID=2710758 RepID=A0A7S8E9W3_9CHLR|nr:hypothetical protein [Phototrophicus methaneseepsis]MAU11802.1 hypothetical protein [Anaerolineaceae bacterium]QPC83088.1 hypothetical protein G4Y79_01550 [Phototrophicus methaneseepsis]
MNAQDIKIEAIENTTGCGCGSAATSCGCASNTLIAIDNVPVQRKSTWMKHLQACLDDGKTIWGKIRGFVMFTIACIASPCCTLLIVPVVIALLAGSPVAIWMSQNLGLVYGGLTLISILSFVLGFRWMRKTNRNMVFAQPESSLVSSTPKTKR